MLIVHRYNTTSLHCKSPLLKETVLCSQYFDHASQEVHECFVQRPKVNVKIVSNANVPGSSKQISNEREEEPIVADACIWFFDIEKEQSCNNRNEHVPVLCGAECGGARTRLFWLRFLQTFVLQSLTMKQEFGNKNGSSRTLAADSIFCSFFNGYTSKKRLFPN